MSAKWHVRRGQKELGPFSLSKVRSLAEAGRLKPADQVRRVDGDSWRRADAVAGLFDTNGGLSEDDGLEFEAAEDGLSAAPVAAGESAPGSRRPTKWHYGQGADAVGPVSWTSLRNAARSGEVRPSTLVWAKGFDEWRPASEIDGLIETDPDAPPPIPRAAGSGPSVVDFEVPDGVKQAGRKVLAGAGKVLAGPEPEDGPAVPQQPHGGAWRTAVLVLPIVAAFFSIFVGGCTAAVSNGLADAGDGLNEWSSNFDRDFGRYGGRSIGSRVETDEVRSLGATSAFLQLVAAVIGVTGGILAYRHFGTTTRFDVGSLPVGKVRLAGILLLFAVVINFTNILAFITAGVMNGVSAALCILNKPLGAAGGGSAPD